MTLTWSPETPTRRGFWPMRDLPVVGWLLATVAVALVHPFVPAPRWLLIHLLLLGAVTHAIVVWSRYFADALLHRPPDPSDRPVQNRRLVLLDLGVLLVVTGVVTRLWVLTLLGAAGVAAAVLWHAWALLGDLRRALPARFAVTVRYYVAAAALLPVGATLGVLLAREPADPWHQQLLTGHVAVNLLGWMGLTVLGTLVTLWPTMLRTRVAEGVERAAAIALPLLAGAVLAVVSAAVADQRWLLPVGLAGYLFGAGLLGRSLVAVARNRPPRTFPTLSVAAALCWFGGVLAALVPATALADDWAAVGDRLTLLTPYLAAGFGAQVLLGALSFLVPVALGGGGVAVAAANAVLDRAGALRVVVVNLGLLVCLLPVPAAVRVLVSATVLVALAAFLPLLVLAIRASRTHRQGAGGRPVAPHPPARLLRAAAAGVAVVLVSAGAGVAVDRGGLDLLSTAPPVAAGVTPTGHTTVVEVAAHDMRFEPSVVEVPAGDRLVIELRNTDDEDVHDLVLDSGLDTGRLAPGESATLDVGVVGRDVAGWCSVIGHHRLGMALTIDAVGAPAAGSADPGADADSDPSAVHEEHSHDQAAPGTTPLAPGAAFSPYDATLPPVGPGTTHRVTLHVREQLREVAPGVTQTLWTFGGSAPGPVLHGRVGDVFVITLVNEGSIGHSIDFHAGQRAPDRVMRTIPPGGRLVYRFRAERAGIWMYHCSSMPMSAHIANGLFGAVVIDPPGLPPVDRSYVLTQSELYLGPEGGEVDVDKLLAERPDHVVFNGYANQYDHRPLRARVGERVRIWVLDAGPNRGSSFHVVGGQFDATWAEGAWLLRRGSAGGSQTLALGPSQGGFVELVLREPGRYPFVSHLMVDAERGAHGLLEVTR